MTTSLSKTKRERPLLPGVAARVAVGFIALVLPSAKADEARREIAIAKLSGEPKVDGNLDKAVWQEATQLYPFQKYGATIGPTQQTRVRIGWTTDALFVAYQCQEEKMGDLRANAVTRDENQWLDDSVELFLDVEGKRQSSFQFIVSAANSQYDGRVRVDGPAQRQDGSWNGRWESAVQKAADHWSVEIKIPFAELGVTTPTADTRWAINAARTRFPAPDERSSWSYCSDPNKGFPNFAALVDARFASNAVVGEFAGIPAPHMASVTNLDEPKLIAPISKEIKPQELGGVAVRPAVQKGEVPILISKPVGLTQIKSWPVRCGVPFPRGTLASANNVRLVDASGQAVPLQAKVLGTWDEGKSVRWLLVNFNAALDGRYTLQFGTAVTTAALKPPTPLTVSQNKDYIEVTTGGLKLHVSKHRHTVIDQIWWQGRPLLRSDGRRGAWEVDQDGHVFGAAQDATEYSVEVEQAGPLRAVIKARSWFDDGQGNRLNQSISRIHIMAGSPVIQVQHTFVLTQGTKQHQYKNISFSLPLAQETCDVKRSVAQPVAYDAYRDNWRKAVSINSSTFSVTQLGNRKAQVLDGDQSASQQNECAGGWVDVAGNNVGLGLAARWFSQNYPNELQLTDDGYLTYHFWSPRYALMDLRPKPWLTMRGNYEPWHTVIANEIGKNLKRWHEVPVEDGGTMDADGAGVAKTHDFALIVHGGAASNITEQAGAYLDEVYAYVDPKWVASSEVFQRSLPAGDPHFKNEDAMQSGLMMRMMADQRNEGLYDARFGASLGIFDFGDDVHQRKYPHRYYAGLFYCSPTLPWAEFLRSGTRTARELAEADSRHHMDVDMCHYTADADSPVRTGAWADDDSGILHWANYKATHYSTSNYGVHLAYMYYLTGDERARDVALEVADALKWAAKKDGLARFSHRATGMTLWNIIELRLLTGDPELKTYADHYADVHVKAVRDGLALGYYPESPVDFTMSYVMPAMIRYHMLTGNRDVAQWIVNQAAYLAENQQSLHEAHFSHWDGLAYAYQLTGDTRYLQAAATDLGDRINEIKRDTPDLYWYQHPFIGYRVWRGYQTPMLLAMLEKSGQSTQAAQSPIRGNDLLTTDEIVILNESAKPLQINVQFQQGSVEKVDLEKAVQAGDLAVVLKNPRGQVVDRAAYPGGSNFDPWLSFGPWRPKLADIKAPMAGVYRVAVQSSTGKLPALLKPLASTSGRVMSRISNDDNCMNGQRYFAYVGKGTDKFGFRVKVTPQMEYGDPTTFARIYLPDGTEAASVDYKARRDELTRDMKPDSPAKWLDVTVDVPPGMDGKVWQIEPPPYVPVRKMEIIGSAPYIAATSQSCFEVPPAP